MIGASDVGVGRVPHVGSRTPSPSGRVPRVEPHTPSPQTQAPHAHPLPRAEHPHGNAHVLPSRNKCTHPAADAWIMRARLLLPRHAVRTLTVTLLLPLSLGVTVPEVRRCGVNWADVWLECALVPELCRVESARCSGPGCEDSGGCPSRCGGDSCGEEAAATTNPGGAEAMPSACVSVVTSVVCPSATCDGPPATVAGLQPTHPVPQPNPEPRDPAAGGEAYCIAAPAGGPTPRAEDPVPEPEASAITILLAPVVEPPRPDLARFEREHAARPPTEYRGAIAPVRGPPMEETV